MIPRILKRLPFFGADKGGTSGAGRPSKSKRTLTTAERRTISAQHNHTVRQPPIEFNKFEEVAKRHGSPLTKKIYEHRKKYWNQIKKLELEAGVTVRTMQPIIKKIELVKNAIAEGKATPNTIHLAAEQIETLLCRMVDTTLMAGKGKQSLEHEFPAEEWNSKFIKGMAKLWPTFPLELQQIVIERLEKEIKT